MEERGREGEGASSLEGGIFDPIEPTGTYRHYLASVVRAALLATDEGDDDEGDDDEEDGEESEEGDKGDKEEEKDGDVGDVVTVKGVVKAMTGAGKGNGKRNGKRTRTRTMSTLLTLLRSVEEQLRVAADRRYATFKWNEEAYVKQTLFQYIYQWEYTFSYVLKKEKEVYVIT